LLPGKEGKDRPCFTIAESNEKQNEQNIQIEHGLVIRKNTEAKFLVMANKILEFPQITTITVMVINRNGQL